MVLFQGTEMGGIADVTPDELVVPEVVVFDCDISPVCNKDVEEGDQQGIFCERFKTWHHHTCLKMTPTKFKQLQLTKEHQGTVTNALLMLMKISVGVATQV